MQTKDFRAVVKAAGPGDDLAEGEFRALVSVFGNVDSVGDVVMPGAFADDLVRWAGKGDPIPVIWAHDWSDPFSHVGTVLEAKESPDGLEVHARIEDVEQNPKAAQVYRLLKGRRVTQMSFAYDVEDGAWAERDGQEVYELRKLRVHEVGPCLLGANQETQLLAAKAHRVRAAAKAGRAPDEAAVAALREARDQITAVLDGTQTPAAAAAATTDEPSQQAEPATDEDPAGGKSDPPAKGSPRRARAVAIAMQMS